jgi:hypothetical protein
MIFSSIARPKVKICFLFRNQRGAKTIDSGIKMWYPKQNIPFTGGNMKRSAFFVILLAFSLLMVACGGADGSGDSPDENNNAQNNPQEDGTQIEKPDSGEDGPTQESENGEVTLNLSSDGKMTVTISIEQASGKDVSVVIVKDKEDASLWQSSPEKVLALVQLTLDAEGKGSISLPVSESSGYTVLVSYDGGSALAVWQ